MDEEALEGDDQLVQGSQGEAKRRPRTKAKNVNKPGPPKKTFSKVIIKRLGDKVVDSGALQ